MVNSPDSKEHRSCVIIVYYTRRQPPHRLTPRLARPGLVLSRLIHTTTHHNPPQHQPLQPYASERSLVYQAAITSCHPPVPFVRASFHLRRLPLLPTLCCIGQPRGSTMASYTRTPNGSVPPNYPHQLPAPSHPHGSNYPRPQPLPSMAPPSNGSASYGGAPGYGQPQQPYQHHQSPYQNQPPHHQQQPQQQPQLQPQQQSQQQPPQHQQPPYQQAPPPSAHHQQQNAHSSPATTSPIQQQPPAAAGEVGTSRLESVSTVVSTRKYT